MRKKNIVIAPCGNKSFLFQDAWLADFDKRNFDLCLLFYHEHVDQPNLYESVDFFFHLKDFKYQMIYKLLMQIKPEWLNDYEYFYFLDDDIQISTEDINQMFLLSQAFSTSIAQASLSEDSFCSWPMFKQHKNCFLRYVGQIEVMAPLFHADVLRICLPSFIDSRSSWGMDSVWSKILNYPEDKLVVFDTIVMKHTLPVGGGELYVKLGFDPHDEWHAIVDKYGARLHNYREYGRLKSFHINNSFFYQVSNFIREGSIGLQRNIKDYNIISRIKSKWNNFFNLKEQS